LFENRIAVGDAGGVGHGGAGGERVGRGVGGVGDHKRNLLGGIGGLGGAGAFDGGKVLADGVDLGDGRAGKHEGPVGGDEIVEGDFVVNGFLGVGEPAPPGLED